MMNNVHVKKIILSLGVLILGIAFNVEAGSYPPDAFVILKATSKVDSNNEITIKIVSGKTYDYTVDWGDGNTNDYKNADAVHIYTNAGDYTIEITGVFPQPKFSNDTNLKEIKQWGTIEWESMANAFDGCSNLQVTATDTPNLSKVTDMSFMFARVILFNEDINNWDVSKVTNMEGMFSNAIEFDKNLNDWDVSSVTNMDGMFFKATKFNGNISSWNVASVINMESMFEGATSFNQNIGNWNTGSLEVIMSMFKEASSFNQDLNNWNVSNVTNMDGVFEGANNFNGNISNWNVSSVTTMKNMFKDLGNFDKDISSWDVSSVTDVSNMFANCTSFNKDIGGWNFSSLSKMEGVLLNASSFNQDIGGWNISGVTSLKDVLSGAKSFNQDVRDWDVSNVTDMTSTFFEAISFDQNIGDWNVSNVTDMNLILKNNSLSISNYDSLLIGWSTLTLTSGVELDAGGSKYSCISVPARANILSQGWTINDGGMYNVPPPEIDTTYYVRPGKGLIEEDEDIVPQIINANKALLPKGDGVTLIWYDEAAGTTPLTGEPILDAGKDLYKSYYAEYSDITGCKSSRVEVELKVTNSYTNTDYFTIDFYISRSGEKITIPVYKNLSYRYIVDWGDGNGLESTAYTSDASHTYTGDAAMFPTIFTVHIRGDFPGIHFNNTGITKNKLRNIVRWGDRITWESLENAFYGCTNLEGFGTVDPCIINLDSLKSTAGMFRGTKKFVANADISNWNVSSIEDMSNMFSGAEVFDQDISGWNVSNVKKMDGMLSGVEFEQLDYDKLLISWNKLKLQSGVNFDGGKSKYCHAAAQRDSIKKQGWEIIDGGSAGPEAPKTISEKGEIIKCNETLSTLDANDDITSTAKIRGIKWYDSEFGDNEVINPILDKEGSVTYYAEFPIGTTNECPSDRTPVFLAIAKGTSISEIEGERTFCDDGPIILKAIGDRSAYSYRWLFKGEEIIGENDSILKIENISQENRGNYVVFVRNACGEAESQIHQVEVKESAIEQIYEDILVVNNSEGKFLSSGYQWYRNGTQIKGANAQFYKTNKNTEGESLELDGEYHVDIPVKGGLRISSCGIVFEKGATTTSKTKKTNISLILSPNPVGKDSILNIKAVNLGTLTPLSFSIYDLTGVLMLKSKMTEKTKSIKVNKFKVGVYVVHVYMDNGERVMDKFIVR